MHGACFCFVTEFCWLVWASERVSEWVSAVMRKCSFHTSSLLWMLSLSLYTYFNICLSVSLSMCWVPVCNVMSIYRSQTHTFAAECQNINLKRSRAHSHTFEYCSTSPGAAVCVRVCVCTAGVVRSYLIHKERRSCRHCRLRTKQQQQQQQVFVLGQSTRRILLCTLLVGWKVALHIFLARHT